MDCRKRVIQKQNQRSFLESLIDMGAFIASSQFAAKQLGVMNMSRCGQQFQTEGLVYSQIISVFFRNRELLLVGGGMILKLIAEFLSHKHPCRKFFRGGMMGRLMMSMLSQRNKFFTPTCVGNIITRNNFLTSVAFDPTGLFMATSSCDWTAKVWRMSPDGAAATCVVTLKGHRNCVSSVAFDPTGCFVATGSWDNTAKLWRLSPDGAAATCVATLEGHSDRVSSVAFDPTGGFVATGSADGTAKLWLLLSDVSFATCVATLKGHSDSVTSVAFHPKAPLLATSSKDKTVILWR